MEIYGDLALARDEKDIDGAIKQYKQATAVKPDYYDVYIKMGKLFEKDKDIENATAMFRKAVEVNPTSPYAHFRLGWVFIRNGDR